LPITAVLFDMFDTLMLIEKDHAFYSPAVKSMHSYLVQNGVQVSFATFRDAYIKARDGLYEAADEKMEEPHFNFRVKNALEILGCKVDAQSVLVQGATDAFCREFMTYVRIDEDTLPVLRKIHKKYKLGIVSNFAIPECVTKLLKRDHLDEFFDIVIVSAAVNKRKPGPEIFRIALDMLALQPTQAVFVGDTVDADIKGGRDAGMKTVYLERRPQKDLETISPDHTIKSLHELPAILEKL
jgi:HAD superfamily hydrolase (TIGR01509 family)